MTAGQHTMKAIVRSEYGSADVLELKDIDKPVVNDDEVLVRVHAAGVNMADVDFMLGRPEGARLMTGLRKPRNRALGLDVAGQVQAVGKDVTGLAPGDEVFGDLTEYGFGAFAEYVSAPVGAFALKPANLTFEEAATVPQAGVMALQGLRSGRSIRPGDQVLINGAGGNVGPFAVQIAKSFGAQVTGVDSTAKLDMLRSIGADDVIDYTQEDYTQGEQRYDRILDVAAYRSFFESKRALKPKGVYVMVPATMTRMFQAMAFSLVTLAGRQKMGMLMGRPFKKEDVAFLTELIEAGKVTPVIERSYPLDEVPAALRYQQEGHPNGKLVITLS